MSYSEQNKVLRTALSKPTLWTAYKYYQRRAVIYGFERISLTKFRNNYWLTKPKPAPIVN